MSTPSRIPSRAVQVASTSPWPHATAAHLVFDEMAKRDVVSWNSIVGVYLFSGENHGVRLVSLASQFRLGCCCACSLAVLLAGASLALPPAARCAACLHYSVLCVLLLPLPCCNAAANLHSSRWLCCHCHFDCWMLLFFYSCSTTPQVLLQQRSPW
jgi:hypothetical protein